MAAEVGHARDAIADAADAAFSYNANHSCTDAAVDVPKKGWELAIRGEVDWEMPGIHLFGYADLTMPCPATGAQHVGLTLDFDKWGIQMLNVKVDASLACAPAVKKNTRMFSMTATAKTLSVFGFTITDLSFTMDGFSEKDVDKGGVSLSEMWFNGTARGPVNIMDQIETTAIFTFSTGGPDAGVGFSTSKLGELGESLVDKGKAAALKALMGLDLRYETDIQKTHIVVKATGKVSPTCKVVGDMVVTGEASLTNLPILGDVSGSAEYQSDCKSLFKVAVELHFEHPTFDVGGINVHVPRMIKFEYDK